MEILKLRNNKYIGRKKNQSGGDKDIFHLSIENINFDK